LDGKNKIFFREKGELMTRRKHRIFGKIFVALRHCEQSEAIQKIISGLLRIARNDKKHHFT